MVLLSSFRKKFKRKDSTKLLTECSTVIIQQIREANITVIKMLSFAYKLLRHPEAPLYLSNILLNPLRIIGLIIRNAKYVMCSAILYSAPPTKKYE